MRPHRIVFYKEVIANAMRWKFPAIEGAPRSRIVYIDYRFEIRGIRNPEDNVDVDVTFELPNKVIVVAPFDANVPCRIPPLE